MRTFEYNVYTVQCRHLCGGLSGGSVWSVPRRLSPVEIPQAYSPRPSMAVLYCTSLIPKYISLHIKVLPIKHENQTFTLCDSQHEAVLKLCCILPYFTLHSKLNNLVLCDPEIVGWTFCANATSAPKYPHQQQFREQGKVSVQ